MTADPAWGSLAPDNLFRAGQTPDLPKVIDNRGMVVVNRGLVSALKDKGFTHATPEYAGTGTTYLHAIHPSASHPVTMRFSTHAHDVKEGGSERPFGVLKGQPGRERLHYDIPTAEGAEVFRDKLNAMQRHLFGQEAAEPGGQTP